ncbi:MAG: M24 family metallopeptidase, partial [Candidatus Omnitrophica bacterium]|nr:M24 family metallopeptidase [Candidatus Omnitrophota bacterium]
AFKNALNKKGIKFTPLSGIAENMRMIKDADEIRKIKKAVGIAKKVFFAFTKKLRPGKTEAQLYRELNCLIADFGAEEEAFSTIVAAGERASRPHAAPTNRVLRKNEPVLIDFGVKVDSYNCDLTRVCFLGKIQQQLYNIYNTCKEAQRRAIALIRPGVSAKEVDRVARGFIESKGFGKAFGHSLGHGIGLSVHESPRISSKSETILKPGMVITIEPGIYIEGLGGVRIEDMALVTTKGCQVLTDDIPK